jgi:hypothetical protein
MALLLEEFFFEALIAVSEAGDSQSSHEDIFYCNLLLLEEPFLFHAIEVKPYSNITVQLL